MFLTWCFEAMSSNDQMNVILQLESIPNFPNCVCVMQELDRLIQKHIDGDSSALGELKEKIVSIQESTESWKRKMTELQQQVVEVTQLQQQHDLRRSHLRHKVTSQVIIMVFISHWAIREI